MRLRISREAAEDLEFIWTYSREKWSVEQANRYYHFIFEEIDLICRNPLAGLDYSHIRLGYRKVSVKSQSIFYRIVEADNSLEIIRILHQKMDVDLNL